MATRATPFVGHGGASRLPGLEKLAQPPHTRAGPVVRRVPTEGSTTHSPDPPQSCFGAETDDTSLRTRTLQTDSVSSNGCPGINRGQGLGGRLHRRGTLPKAAPAGSLLVGSSSDV